MYSSITRNKSDWDGKIDAGMNGRERECLFASIATFFITKDASVAGDPKEGDRNQNCSESSDQVEDTCNKGM